MFSVFVLTSRLFLFDWFWLGVFHDLCCGVACRYIESAAALGAMLRFCTTQVVEDAQQSIHRGAQAQVLDSLVATYFRTAHKVAWPRVAVLPCAGYGAATSVAWVAGADNQRAAPSATVPPNSLPASLCAASFMSHADSDTKGVALANVRVAVGDAWRVQLVCPASSVPAMPLDKFFSSAHLWQGLAQDAELLVAMSPEPSLQRTPGAPGKPKLDRRPLAPFMAGDTFRAHCRFSCNAQGCNHVPSMLRAGDCVAVDMTDAVTGAETIAPVRRFLAGLDDLSVPVVLVTHNGDLSMPDVDSHMPYESDWPQTGFSRYLEHPNLAAWFASNCYWEGYPAGRPRPAKLTCIPIGIENRYNFRGADKHPTLSDQFAELQRLHAVPWHLSRVNTLLVDVKEHPWKPERAEALKVLRGKPWVTFLADSTYKDWAEAVRSHKFILCPAGHGQDTHRTWQALLLGAVPVVKTSAMDSMYEGLPVVIVKSWKDVSVWFLEHQWNQLRSRSFHMDRTLWPFWRDKALAAQHLAATAAAASPAVEGEEGNEEEAEHSMQMLPARPSRMNDPCVDPFPQLVPPPGDANELAVFAINISAETLGTRAWHALRSWLRDAVQHGLRVLFYMGAEAFAQVDTSVRGGSAPAKLACLWSISAMTLCSWTHLAPTHLLHSVKSLGICSCTWQCTGSQT